jgi:hypothetical protein
LRRFGNKAFRERSEDNVSSKLLFDLPDEVDDLLGLFGRLQALAQLGITKEPNQASQDGQVLGDGWRHDQEKKASRKRIGGAVGDALGMAAEHYQRGIDESYQRIPRVGQSDTVSDTSAVELFAFLQGSEKGLPCLGLVRQFRDLVHQFAQNRFAVAARQIQLNARGGEQFVQPD